MAPSPALTPAPQAPDVYRAICQVAKAMSHDGIAKDKKNDTQGYKFRGIDDFFNALSAVLSGAELCIIPRMVSRTQDERTTKNGGVLFHVTVEAQFDFISARDGSMHTAVMYGEAMDSGDKATNKAMSAAYKYAAMQVFCIPTEGMEDADSTTHAPVPKQQQSPPPTPHREPSYKAGAPSMVRRDARPVPEELTRIFSLMGDDKKHFQTARESYRDQLEVAGGAAEYMRLTAAFDAIKNRTATHAREYLLDLYDALGVAESKIGVTA